MQLPFIPDHARSMALSHGFSDDFQGFLTASSTDKYTVVTVTDGSALQIDTTPGGVAIKSAVASAAGDEDCYLVREAETFLFTGRPLEFEALVQATEDDVNQNNLIVGLTNAAAADLLVTAGAGPKTSGNTIAFYKVDGGLNWWVHGRDDGDTTVFSIELTAANSLDKVAHVGSGASYQKLNIKMLARTSTVGDIIFSIDDVPVYKYTGFLLSGNTDVQAVCGCKDGDAGDETTINLRYWWCYQSRN